MWLAFRPATRARGYRGLLAAGDGSFSDSFITCKSIKALSVFDYSNLLGSTSSYQHNIGAGISRWLDYILDQKRVDNWSKLISYQHIEILSGVIELSADIRYFNIFAEKDIVSDIDKPDISISYAGFDKTFALRVAKDLGNNGLRVWIAEWDLDYGESIIGNIGEAINKARLFAVVLLPEAAVRPWVRVEMQTAFHAAVESNRSNVFGMMYRKTEMPNYLRGRRWMDFNNADDYPARILDLYDTLRGAGRSVRNL